MPDYLDVRKFELDKKRFRFEKEKYAAENRVIIKHFSVTITAMISAAAVLISGFQALISYNSLSKIRESAVFEKQKAERAFHTEVGKFLMDKQNDILSSNLNRVKYVQHTLIVALPGDVLTNIATIMRDLATDPEIKSSWANVVEYGRVLIRPKVIQADLLPDSGRVAAPLPTNNTNIVPGVSLTVDGIVK